jgi:hypothetical protein
MWHPKRIADQSFGKGDVDLEAIVGSLQTGRMALQAGAKPSR